jgi:5-methylcytosine-specific restriction endonuclease McrA
MNRLPRRTPLKRSPLARKPGQLKRTPLRPVSKRRERENRLRRKAMHEAYGTDPMCHRCRVRPARDAHELTRRSAGGSILDPANCRPVCAECHRFLHDNPVAAKAEGWLT